MYGVVLHHTFLLLHGATPYISITTRTTPYISITTWCYTIHFYYYTVLHHTFLLLHGTTPYISITTRVLHHTFLLLHSTTPYISITTRVLHHTFLLLHGATPYISITTRCYTIHFYYYTVKVAVVTDPSLARNWSSHTIKRRTDGCDQHHGIRKLIVTIVNKQVGGSV